MNYEEDDEKARRCWTSLREAVREVDPNAKVVVVDHSVHVHATPDLKEQVSTRARELTSNWRAPEGRTYITLPRLDCVLCVFLTPDDECRITHEFVGTASPAPEWCPLRTKSVLVQGPAEELPEE